MAGGVAEWTSSLYQPNAKPTDPLYGQYTIKGDAWSLPPDGLQGAFRTSGAADYSHPTIGFRLASDWPVKHIGTPQQDQPQAPAPAAPAAAAKPKVPPKPKRSRAQEIIHKMG